MSKSDGTTKITARLVSTLRDKFDKRCRECFIKRDQFLDHVIALETPRLSRDLGDTKLSKKARRFISNSLTCLGTHTVNWKVRKSTASALKEVQRRTNLCRDAFFNRLLLLLLARRGLIEKLGLMTEYFDEDPKGSGPMELIGWTVADPLEALHDAAQESNDLEVDKSLYRMDLSPLDFVLGARPKHITEATLTNYRAKIALACKLDDRDVPGTRAYADAMRAARDLSLDDDLNLVIRPKGEQQS